MVTNLSSSFQNLPSSGKGGPTQTYVDQSGRFHQLQGSFQRQLQALAKEFYAIYHQPLVLTDTVRTQAKQAKAHQEKPSLALPAGHPNAMHPKGLAVDVDSRQAALLTGEMLAKYGLHRPALSKGETWHLEPIRIPDGTRCAGSSSGRHPQNAAELARLLNRASADGNRFSPPAAVMNPDQRRLLQAAREVEAIFLENLWRQSRRAMVEPVGSSGKKHHDYISIAEHHLARSLAAGGGLGLADKILAGLSSVDS